MSACPITSIYAALCGLLLLWLSWRVVEVRRSERIGLGHADNRLLERRVRIHGNFVEHVPMVLLLMALAEGSGIAAWALHLAGATLVLARLLHAWGLSMSAGLSTGRFWGVLLTWLTIFGLSLHLLLHPWLY